MFFAVDLHVRFGQGIDRLTILPRIEDQVSIARPDNAAFVEIAEIIVDLFRVKARSQEFLIRRSSDLRELCVSVVK